MLHDFEDTTTAWLQDPVKSWREWPMPLDKSLTSVENEGILEKVNEDKLARDVDDLSAIFEELAEGVVDFPLPCDDELATGSDVAEEWIDSLDSDAMNVNDISEAFDALVAEQELAMSKDEATLKKADETTSASYSSSEYDDDDDEDMEDSDDEDESPRVMTINIIPSPPVWANMVPLDPRSCIKTAVFKNVDSRIPRVNIPRMDLSFAAKAEEAKTVVGPLFQRESAASESEKLKMPEYRHDPATCWICKSSKTPEKKRAIHRYLEKRSRRNWKKGPRYSGRSNVAASRVRNGGRFICTTQWI
ncbi:Cct domain, partial [Globisporangium splendens]